MKYWQINSNQVKLKEGSLKDVVLIIHYSRIAKEVINDKEYTASIIGTYTCPEPKVGDFTPYNELTEQDYCKWLDEAFDVKAMDESLDNMINQEAFPPIVNMPLPWQITTTTTTTTDVIVEETTTSTTTVIE